jgi:hypothetical protein
MRIGAQYAAAAAAVAKARDSRAEQSACNANPSLPAVTHEDRDSCLHACMLACLLACLHARPPPAPLPRRHRFETRKQHTPLSRNCENFSIVWLPSSRNRCAHTFVTSFPARYNTNSRSLAKVAKWIASGTVLLRAIVGLAVCASLLAVAELERLMLIFTSS